MKQAQKLELRMEKDVINGFSYSFSKTLLEKLKELEKEGRVFVEGGRGRMTDIALVVSDHLYKQLFSCSCSLSREDEVRMLIASAEEFLSIFEKK